MVFRERPTSRENTCRCPAGLPFHSSTPPKEGSCSWRSQWRALPRAALALAASQPRTQVPDNQGRLRRVGLGSAKVLAPKKKKKKVLEASPWEGKSCPRSAAVTWGMHLVWGGPDVTRREVVRTKTLRSPGIWQCLAECRAGGGGVLRPGRGFGEALAWSTRRATCFRLTGVTAAGKA